MKILQLSIPTVALAAVFTLSVSPESTGFSKLGTQLNGFQRDFRIFNNFTDPSANNNTVIHPSFPGYDGAELCIWKGSVEWGSLLHGDGEGDPHQPFGLGSGGANFDATFQGNAVATGNTNSNVHSQIAGAGGGVLAFAEGPANDGWRIRYYELVDWRDGPNPISSGFDLQSVATHEYGHAIGLGHSGTGAATMTPAVAPGTSGARSIHADDIAGLQCIYGVATIGVKPVITSLNEVGNTLTITGMNFDPLDNRVWFTQAIAGGTGLPIEVLNWPSSAGGTVIVVPTPAAAGPGDVLIKNQAAGGESLSNAMPFDPNPPVPCITYCPSLPNGTGSAAVLSCAGDPNSSMVLTTTPVPNTTGQLFYGPMQLLGGSMLGDGPRCVGGATQRVLPFITAGMMAQPANTSIVTLNYTAPYAAGLTGTQYFQYWFRSGLGTGTGSNTSNGVSITF